MERQNPFNITFGKLPIKIINRQEVSEKIITSFTYKNPTTQLYTLVGPRGCGKTVLMTSIANYFKEDKKWIVVDLNPHDDMMEQLAASIYQNGKVKRLFVKAEFSFSFQGVGFSISGSNPVSNIFSLLDLMFEYLKKKDYSVLVTIDEANNNEYMKVFAHSFQSMIRKDYPIFLLMTGLYENISSLENEKSLTFLYRAPKIYLEPLNLRAIAYSYMDQLGMEEDEAIKAAKLTKGYAFAYQLLGYILFEQGKTIVDKAVIREFDLLLDEKSYSKIWSELTEKEKDIIIAVAKGNNKNQDLMEELGMRSNYLATYKILLRKKGIIDTDERAILKFALPRFKEFVLFRIELD